MDKITRKVFDFLDRNNLSIYRVSKDSGVPQSTIGAWRTKGSKPTYESIEKICKAYNLPNDFFYDDDSDEDTDIYWNKIPILGSVPCGEPTEAIEEIIGYIEVLPNMAKDHFGLIAKGDSMAPKIEKGDILIIKKDTQVQSGDIAIVKVNGDEATCKKIMLTDEGITLISLNPNYEPRFFTNAQIESLPIKIIGKVKEIRRKL